MTVDPTVVEIYTTIAPILVGLIIGYIIGRYDG